MIFIVYYSLGPPPMNMYVILMYVFKNANTPYELSVVRHYKYSLEMNKFYGKFVFYCSFCSFNSLTKRIFRRRVVY